MRIAFITPPPVKPSEPGLSAGAAATVLRRQGVDALWVDASIRWHRFALDPDRLTDVLQGSSAAALSPKGRLAMVRAAESLRGIVPPLARPATYANRHVYSSAVNNLENALRIAALPFDGFRLGVAMVALERPVRRLESSAALAWLAESPGPFDAYFVEELIPSLQRQGITHAAVSLTFQQQGPAAFRLARLLQEHAPSIERILGGPLVACWKAVNIPLDRGPFTSFHHVLEGTADDLAELAKRMGGANGSASLSPDSVDGPLCVPAEQACWGDYLAPVATVPAALGRGCSWRRCTFCPDHLHPAHHACAPDTLSDWLYGIAQRFPTGAMLHFTDSALPPGHLERVAEVIRVGKLPLRWHGFIRAEEAFARPGFAKHLAEGGCSMLQVGIESGSPRLLQAMGKGGSPEVSSGVLRAAASAGIRNHVYLLFGMPTESDDDREGTLQFIKRDADAIHALNPALLNLPKGSPMHRYANRFGISEILPFGQETDLSLYDDFRCGVSHPRREARVWLARRFFKDPSVREIQGGLRATFKANHLCFLDT